MRNSSLLLLIPMLLLASAVFSDDTPESTMGKLDLVLTAPAEALTTVDVLPVLLTLTNSGEQAFDLNQFSDSSPRFYISEGSGEFHKVPPSRPNRGGVPGRNAGVLGVGEILRCSEILSPGLRGDLGFRLPIAGVLRIKARFEGRSAALDSNVLEITIASGESLPPATRAILETESYHRFITGGNALPKDFALSSALDLLRHPLTPLQGDLLRLRLGRYYQDGMPPEIALADVYDMKTHQKTGQKSKVAREVHDYNQAITHYGAILKSGLLQVRAEASLRFAECCMKLNRVAEARISLEHASGSESPTWVRARSEQLKVEIELREKNARPEEPASVPGGR